MIVVTGGAGFIGSNLVKALNERGHDDILVVDDLRDGTKFINLADCTLGDYLDKDDFLSRVRAACAANRRICRPSRQSSTKGHVPIPRSGMAASCSRTTSSIPRSC